ncbi:MAG: hydroxypyruvate isomerase family protein [Gammaproteobacteria bacterium]
MKFSANLSMLFTELAWPDRFEAARRYGFDAVEIQFPYFESPETLSRFLTDKELKLVLFNVDADDLLQGGEGLASVPEKRDHFVAAVDQAVEYIKVLRPEAVNVLPGRCLEPQREPEYRETFKGNLRYAADVFAPLGVKTVFEAINTVDMPGFIVHSGRQMLDWLDELKHPDLYMQYDIYHMHKMGEAVADFIASHAGRIGHIQFADDPGRGEPGTGKIDFAALFEVIRRSGYAGWIGAEYKPSAASERSLEWFNAVRDREDRAFARTAFGSAFGS